MATSGLALWSRTAIAAAGAATLLAVAHVSVVRAYPLGVTVAFGAGAGTALFVVLAGAPRPGHLRHAGEAPALLAKALFLAVTAASEEVIWRWFVLGGLTGVVGALPALSVSTLAFALAHAGWQGRRGVVVHLLTGGTFGTVFLVTGSLASAVTAHVTYNVLIALAVHAERGDGGPAERLGRRADREAIPAELRAVDKRFGKTQALSQVDLDVRRGEVVALLGPNGAGKTTAVSILLGLRRPDKGRAFLFGRDPREPRTRQAIGATPQDVAFPPTLTVAEVVDFVRAHYTAPASQESLLERFGLAEIAGRQAGGLSGGQRRRLALALAFAANPDAVFLDEPTAGLDVDARRSLWDSVEAFADDGGTVLLTTHNLSEAEALASRVVVLSHGRIVADGTVDEIKARGGLKRIRLPTQALPEIAGVIHSEDDAGVCVLYVQEAGEVVRQLVLAGASLEGLEVLPVSLEEAFLVLTRSER